METETETKGWRKVRLDECFDIQQGKQVSKNNRRGDNQHPFLRTANIFWEGLDLEGLDHMNFTPQEEKKFKLQKGDLLLCEGGDVGRTAMWNGELDRCYYQNHLHRLRKLNNEIDENFVLLYLKYAFLYARLYLGRANITTIPNLSKSRLSELEIVLPPLPEQKAIVHVLARIHDAIAEQENLVSKLKELKQSMMHHLFTHGTRSEKTKMTETGEVPESWNEVEIGSLGQIVTGSTPSTKIEKYYSPLEIDFISPGDINYGKYIYSTEKQISKAGFEVSRPIPKDAVCCVCIGSSIGKVAKAYRDSTTNQQINSIICNNNYDTDFIYYLMSFYSGLWRSHATFGPVPLLSKGSFSKINMPVSVDITEQKKIAKMLATIEENIEVAETKYSIYQNLFKTLLHELMSGERRIKF